MVDAWGMVPAGQGLGQGWGGIKGWAWVRPDPDGNEVDYLPAKMFVQMHHVFSESDLYQRDEGKGKWYLEGSGLGLLPVALGEVKADPV